MLEGRRDDFVTCIDHSRTGCGRVNEQKSLEFVITLGRIGRRLLLWESTTFSKVAIRLCLRIVDDRMRMRDPGATVALHETDR